MYYARLYALGFFPIQKVGSCVAVHGPFDEFRWWEGFKQFQTWVQILILLNVIKLKIIED